MTQSSIFLTFPLTITFFIAILRVSKIHTLMRERLIQKYCIILQYFLLMLLACYYLRLSHAHSTLFNIHIEIELLIYLIDAVE
jgi:hypothetical protein